MTPVPYSSLWALGCDCASQELVWQYERATYGHGPFTWAETYDLNLVADLLCGMPETLDDTDAWTYCNNRNHPPLSCVVDTKYKVAYVHHLPEKHTYDSKKSVTENFPYLAPGIRRRYDRLAAELNDPDASPVFCYWSHGYDPRQMTLPYTEDYNLLKAKWFLARLNNHFPAKIGMLYLVNDKRLPAGTPPQHAFSDGQISAWPHGINRSMRDAGQRGVLTLYAFGPCPELRKALVRVPNYDELFAKKVGISERLLPTKHPGWTDYLVVDHDCKRGYRMNNMHHAKYTILDYKPQAYLHVQWDNRSWGEETFIYDEDKKIWILLQPVKK